MTSSVINYVSGTCVKILIICSLNSCFFLIFIKCFEIYIFILFILMHELYRNCSRTAKTKKGESCSSSLTKGYDPVHIPSLHPWYISQQNWRHALIDLIGCSQSSVHQSRRTYREINYKQVTVSFAKELELQQFGDHLTLVFWKYPISFDKVCL